MLAEEIIAIVPPRRRKGNSRKERLFGLEGLKFCLCIGGVGSVQDGVSLGTAGL
jgi:hypothetical protein